MNNTPKKRSRRTRFASWWHRNHHKQQAHRWLTKNSSRIAKCFYLPPDLYEDVSYICKRFAKSEHKRLTQKDAWTLWRVCHPTVNQRTQSLAQTAIMVDTYKHRYEKMKNPQIQDQPELVLWGEKHGS